MLLKPDFQFSQSCLQDYVDCPHRFELCYIQRLAWPALQSEPVIEQERHIELGHRFHRLVHQHALGFPEEVLDSQAVDPDVNRWWLNYRQSDPLSTYPRTRLPEYTLITPYAGYRLLAKFDLLAIQPGERIVIVDWKTSHKRQGSTILKKRVQTRLYPFVLALAGATVNGGLPLTPEQIEMVYWFPEFPKQPEILPYNSGAFQADCEFLAGLINEISTLSGGQFLSAQNERSCIHCIYRSLCGRDGKAVAWDETENEDPQVNQKISPTSSLDIDFSSIGEITF